MNMLDTFKYIYSDIQRDIKPNNFYGKARKRDQFFQNSPMKGCNEILVFTHVLDMLTGHNRIPRWGGSVPPQQAVENQSRQSQHKSKDQIEH